MKNAFFSAINFDTVYANVALPVTSWVVSYTTQRAKKGQQITDSVISNPNTSPPHLFPTGGCSPSSLSGATFPDPSHSQAYTFHREAPNRTFLSHRTFHRQTPPSNTVIAEERTQENFEEHQKLAAKVVQARNINYRPDFKMRGKFSGEPESSTEKWLRKFEYDMQTLKETLHLSKSYSWTKQKSGRKALHKWQRYYTRHQTQLGMMWQHYS